MIMMSKRIYMNPPDFVKLFSSILYAIRELQTETQKTKKRAYGSKKGYRIIFF